MALKFDPKELDEQYTLDKEMIARNWFFVGSELRKIRREFASTKLFGQHIRTTPFAAIENHDRSNALWMFENWREVLDWLEYEIGQPASDPFFTLASLNASHPAHIKRQVRRWQKATGVGQGDEADL